MCTGIFENMKNNVRVAGLDFNSCTVACVNQNFLMDNQMLHVGLSDGQLDILKENGWHPD